MPPPLFILITGMLELCCCLVLLCWLVCLLHYSYSLLRCWSCAAAWSCCVGWCASSTIHTHYWDAVAVLLPGVVVLVGVPPPLFILITGMLELCCCLVLLCWLVCHLHYSYSLLGCWSCAAAWCCCVGWCATSTIHTHYWDTSL